MIPKIEFAARKSCGTYRFRLNWGMAKIDLRLVNVSFPALVSAVSPLRTRERARRGWGGGGGRGSAGGGGEERERETQRGDEEIRGRERDGEGGRKSEGEGGERGGTEGER